MFPINKSHRKQSFKPYEKCVVLRVCPVSRPLMLRPVTVIESTVSRLLPSYYETFGNKLFLKTIDRLLKYY